MSEYRLVICIDVEADSLSEAYRKTYDAMNTLVANSPLEWESSDEAFGPDGEEIDPESLQEARMEVFAQLRKEGKLED